MQVLETLEPMVVQGIKNGMNYKQIRDRIPALVAKKLSIPESEFHKCLEVEAGPMDTVLLACADRIAAQMTAAQAASFLAKKSLRR